MATTQSPLKRAARRALPARRRPPERLAIDGGKPAAPGRYRERWRRIRLRDAALIGWNMLRDVNTHSGGGGAVAIFEKQFAKLTQTDYALAMNSGTAALHSAYYAVGVGPGDEVIVPSYTFFATAAPILQCGATPVFCEIDPRTLTADPNDVQQRITRRTRAISVVHVWGNPAKMDRFAQIAKRNKLALIEDASHAHGATYEGRPVGSWGDVGAFSLQGAKPVSGGEGGIAVTSDPVLYDRMLALAHYPRSGSEQQAATFELNALSLGLKFRPHLYSIQLARGSLARLRKLNRLRRRNYAILQQELEGSPVLAAVPTLPAAVRGGFLEYLLHFDREATCGWTRAALVAAARAEGVPIQADRYQPLHREKLFAQPDLPLPALRLARATRGQEKSAQQHELPVTEQVCGGLVTLPPFTDVPVTFVQQCGQALRKVADYAVSYPPPMRK